MKSKVFKIGTKKAGDGHPCFIIAEAGSNHNGRLSLAKKLIDAAASAGADAVKFQTFRAEKLYVRNAGPSNYLKDPTSVYEIIKSMEMPYEWLPKLSKYCKKKGIIFMSSVADQETASWVNPFVPIHKIGSYESNHYPLLEYVAHFKKPIILSTGADDLQSIRQSLKVLRKTKNSRVCLMHCVATYPASLTSLNLKVIPQLKSIFKVPVGFSDHSRDPLVGPLGAVAVGANLIEKHFTLDNNLPGPDHNFALEPDELKLMIGKMREMESALGKPSKKVLGPEKELFNFAKRGIQAVRDIKKGEIFSEKNIAILRPGRQEKGVSPLYWKTILGKKSRCNIKEGEGVQKECF